MKHLIKFLKETPKIFQSHLKDIDEDYIEKFPFIEHLKNLALALKVCIALGVNKKDALNGMLSTIPHPGALFIWDIKIKINVNLLAGLQPMIQVQQKWFGT